MGLFKVASASGLMVTGGGSIAQHKIGVATAGLPVAAQPAVSLRGLVGTQRAPVLPGSVSKLISLTVGG